MPQGSNIVSPQSNVPNFTPRVPVSLDDTFESSGEVQELPSQAPVTSSGGGVAVNAYNAENPANPKASIVFVQNLGTAPIKYAINATATADAFNGILAGGSAQDDGLGGNKEFNIDQRGITRISLVSTAAVRAMVSQVIKRN